MLSNFRSRLNRIPDEERPLLVFLGLLRRLTSSIPQLLKSVTDGRVQKKIHYSMAECVFSALMMFVTGMKSRRTHNALLRGRRIGQLFRAITGGSQQTVPHCDTVEKAFRKSTPGSLQNLRTRLVQSLIRKKVFDSYRLLGLYLVMAVDGTRYLSRSSRHCAHCLTTRHNDDSTTYYHASLEASIVGSNRLMFPVITEFIENLIPGQNPQDCELTAFTRLARNLDSVWPKLPLILTLDALYACGPVFTTCRQYGWHFIATMKDGSLPEVYADFLGRRILHRGNRIRRTLDSGEVETYTWVNDLRHCGSDRRSHRIHVLECSVTDTTGRRTGLFRWVTSLEITAETTMAIANHGGRIRWNTEEGFKILKRDGFNMEHAFSLHPVASKVYHQIMMLAMLLMQILHKSTLGQLVVRATSTSRQVTFKLLSLLILESLRNRDISREGWNLLRGGTLQIRFVNDS